VSRRLFSPSHFVLSGIRFPPAIPTYPHYRAMIFSPACSFFYNKILFNLELALNIGHILDVSVSVLAPGLVRFQSTLIFFQERSLSDARQCTLIVFAPSTSLGHLTYTFGSIYFFPDI
jgi:hypothetical protein